VSTEDEKKKEIKRIQSRKRMAAYRKRKKQEAEEASKVDLTKTAKGICAYLDCKTVLSKYNKDPYCSKHYKELWFSKVISVKTVINER
jgi:hypothetical protein